MRATLAMCLAMIVFGLIGGIFQRIKAVNHHLRFMADLMCPQFGFKDVNGAWTWQFHQVRSACGLAAKRRAESRGPRALPG